ncbi:MAG: hypothetical protein ACT4OL_04915 [Nitrospiraceae bacterium]
MKPSPIDSAMPLRFGLSTIGTKVEQQLENFLREVGTILTVGEAKAMVQRVASDA